MVSLWIVLKYVNECRFAVGPGVNYGIWVNMQEDFLSNRGNWKPTSGPHRLSGVNLKAHIQPVVYLNPTAHFHCTGRQLEPNSPHITKASESKADNIQ